MTNLYAEWQKLRDNVQSASARLYYEKNENTERKYEEALEMLGQFEKENGIPLMAEEAEVKKMFCPLTNEEWRKTCSMEEYATWLWKHFDYGEVIVLWEKYGCPMYKDDNGVSRADYTEAMKKWLTEKHNE